MFAHFASMRNLYNVEEVKELTKRIEILNIMAPRIDGDMSVTQMLVHCSIIIETASGKIKPAIDWREKAFGIIFKAFFLNRSKSGWCDLSRDPKIHYGFEDEKQRLLALIWQFNQDGRDKCTTHPHKFLGKLTPDRWGALAYKHIDYHLRQFNV